LFDGTARGELDNTITPDGVYKLVRRYALALGLKIGALALRATAAANAPDHRLHRQSPEMA
jgi:hypothetical protein